MGVFVSGCRQFQTIAHALIFSRPIALQSWDRLHLIPNESLQLAIHFSCIHDDKVKLLRALGPAFCRLPLFSLKVFLHVYEIVGNCFHSMPKLWTGCVSEKGLNYFAFSSNCSPRLSHLHETLPKR